MYLNRNKNGYGWYAQIRSKEGESENIGYINFAFKKGCEPLPNECTEYGSYSGEFIFRDQQGAERKVFPIVKEWNGVKHIEFRLLEKTHEYVDPEPSYQPKTATTLKTEPKWDLGKTYQPTLDGSKDEEYWKIQRGDITEDDLPFDE